MAHSLKFQPLKFKGFQGFKEFKEFTFIGNSSEETVNNIEQDLSPGNKVLGAVEQDSSLTIEKVCVARNTARQLKNLHFKPGKKVQLVSKGRNGSVVVSLGDQLIGISSGVAAKIVVSLAS